MSQEPKPMCKTAIVGFIMSAVFGFWFLWGSAVFHPASISGNTQLYSSIYLAISFIIGCVGILGQLLCLIGGIICITKRGAVRGIGWASLGFSTLGMIVGASLAISVITAKRIDWSVGMAVMAFIVLVGGFVAAGLLFVPYLLLAKEEGQRKIPPGVEESAESEPRTLA